MSARRFVFDTNTLVSAILFKGSVPRRAFDRARSLGAVLLSPETFAEAQRVFGLPRFDRYVTPDVRTEFLDTLREQAVWVTAPAPVQASRDPDDDAFLALALAGGAEVIVSGDADLLALHPFRGVGIMTAAAFLAATEPAA